MITVADLKAMLVGIPDETLIVLQKDDEGNGYRYMNGIDFAPPGSDETNYFDGDECYRADDLEELDLEVDDPDLVICAVVF
jgi:hypothetical protein